METKNCPQIAKKREGFRRYSGDDLWTWDGDVPMEHACFSCSELCASSCDKRKARYQRLFAATQQSEADSKDRTDETLASTVIHSSPVRTGLAASSSGDIHISNLFRIRTPQLDEYCRDSRKNVAAAAQDAAIKNRFARYDYKRRYVYTEVVCHAVTAGRK